ncbi:MAG: S-methyl-5'-thioadenosine phosphorylase [Blastochloris sp.]|nr:S-methyl-5'-thioadenosine phosphorylase [Blastochloris sp.]
MSPIPIAIIGGSGLYHMAGLNDVEELQIDTPYGPSSDAIRVGTLNGRRVAFLARHGRHHSLLPQEIPHRANIWALKKLGVRWLISLSAVGSLKEELKPRHFVLPLQFFDRTKNREEHSFFGQGLVAHVSFGQPICKKLATILYQSASTCGATCHWGGTYVNMEGPAFSTLAECQFHRSQGFDVIGMTNLAEAKLAREAEISYASVSMVTDYDCWHESEGEVNVAEVVAILRENAELAQRTVTHAVAQIPLHDVTPCHKALATAIMTPREHWPAARIEQLKPLLTPYL